MKIIDKLDRKILDIMESDSRSAVKEISLKTGVSAGTVANRIKKLLNLKAIKKFTISIDWRKLGFDILAILLIETKYQKNTGNREKDRQIPRSHQTIRLHRSLRNHSNCKKQKHGKLLPFQRKKIRPTARNRKSKSPNDNRRIRLENKNDLPLT